MFEFSRTEYEYICKEAMLNEEYCRLLQMEIWGWTRAKMADDLKVSIDTLDKMILKLKKKIKKIL